MSATSLRSLPTCPLLIRLRLRQITETMCSGYGDSMVVWQYSVAMVWYCKLRWIQICVVKYCSIISVFNLPTVLGVAKAKYTYTYTYAYTCCNVEQQVFYLRVSHAFKVFVYSSNAVAVLWCRRCIIYCIALQELGQFHVLNALNIESNLHVAMKFSSIAVRKRILYYVLIK